MNTSEYRIRVTVGRGVGTERRTYRVHARSVDDALEQLCIRLEVEGHDLDSQITSVKARPLPRTLERTH